MKKTLLMIATLAISEPALCSTLESLNKQQFVNAFVNKTVVSINYDVFNGKVIPSIFSFYLDDQGNVTGKLSKKPNNEEPQTDTGHYYIDQDGAGYFTWKHWYSGKKLCFHLFNTENMYLSIDCNNVFHTAYLKSAIKSGNQLAH